MSNTPGAPWNQINPGLARPKPEGINGLAVDDALVLRTQVEALYQQAAASEQEFCIDLEGEAPDGRLVYEWMGYSRKDNAKVSLGKLIEGIDFSCDVRESTGGRPAEQILFSRDGLSDGRYSPPLATPGTRSTMARR